MSRRSRIAERQRRAELAQRREERRLELAASLSGGDPVEHERLLGLTYIELVLLSHTDPTLF